MARTAPADTLPVELLPPLPPAAEIPSKFLESAKQWWAAGDKQSAISEERLLRRLPFFRSQKPTSPLSESELSDVGPVIAYSSRIELSKPKHYINTLSMISTSLFQSQFSSSESPSASSSPTPAVMLHGYGAGLGFYFRNLLPMAQWASRHNTAVYALDWLGMGRSSRPPFHVKAHKKDVDARVTEAESFFIDSLEDWRQKMHLEKMTLIGHSLGAYFSVVYALKFPQRVERLILLSPAGVPRGPDNTVPASEMDPPSTTSSEDRAEPASNAKVEQLEAKQRVAKARESRSRKILTYLWEEGFSPFQVVRTMGVWGPWLVGKYSSRRFSGLTSEETRDMHDYILNITMAKGSGEYCISHILAPGAHARKPLVDRISALHKDIPVTFVYGDQDWMDPEGGAESVERLRQAGHGKGKMYIVNNAGHHVYLDNPRVVNNLLVKELEPKI
ncbi:alpha/beta-hydrolase [Lentinula raphanica]|uniref:Alpha/beta-hydrolase n=1 Tax=Lentinula raphanica TaxID=153919 RepID=A0AA38PAH1_9AGAR|nr:alpha/beta-hydrolase [Lentinula raphanica]KAJ3768521.1 alpha/beta-hydrolase [Lentinula raphanica]KAJ3829447.1 alpha/beta-hydrolase [Lentinula raphanica]KAJ3839141.1 alpha/beta-hydrolase [Lentinula raphanica]KAJ3967922.1 alpha/beta-hydrolase [Lentinula raphanica]